MLPADWRTGSLIINSHFAAATDRIFNSFPREFASPYRMPVGSRKEFVRKVSAMNHTSSVYGSIYGYNNARDMVDMVDKLYFDIDSHSPPQAWEAMRTLVSRLKGEVGITDDSLTVTYTGKKGWHVYVHMEDQLGGKGIRVDGERFNNLKKKMRGLQEYLTRDIPEADTSVLGDLRQIARVPGVTRPDTGQACIMVPPEWATQHKFSDLYSKAGKSWQRLGHATSLYYKNVLGEAEPIDYSINELIEMIVPAGWEPTPNEVEYASMSNASCNAPSKGIPDHLKTTLLKAFRGDEDLLRAYTSINPRHKTRVRGTMMLYEAGVGTEFVKKIVRKLGWMDYDVDVTRYQLDNLWERHSRQQKHARSLST